MSDKNIHIEHENLLKKNNILVKRYCYSSFWRNVILQKILIKINNNLLKNFNNNIVFSSIKNNMTIKENSIFEIKWIINNKIIDKIGKKIMIILHRENVTNHNFVNIIYQSNNLLQNNYNWNVSINDYYVQFYNNKNKYNYLFHLLIIFPDVYPN